jgi:peptidoglycan/LPS O-acetylase OafA/YrhL
VCRSGQEGGLVKYRADIDGLRTIAVAPVVLYHAGMPFATGGFVGVDVFFVISGYLITKIIAADLEVGRFSILDFYERRIRRIFPALVAVFAFCLAVGYALMTPNDYAGMSRSMLAAALFVSNIFFWRSTNYFDAGSGQEPLLHTWSLSVEEQFYIFLPPAMILLFRFGRGRKVILISALLLSLALSSILVFYKQSATFYLLPTRAWELLVGAVLALKFVPAVRSKKAADALSVLALVAILLPVIVYTHDTRFPGIAALPPTIGAALLIWAGESQTTPVHRLLSTRPFTLCGQASYSLYLWHFPLLVFASYAIGRDLSVSMAAIICVVSVIVSLASLKYIERPFRPRAGGDTGRLRAIRLPAAGMAVAFAAALTVQLNDGISSRMDPIASRFVDADRDRDRHPSRCMSVDQVIVPPRNACRFGAPGARPSAILWGDSHAMVTATAMDMEGRKQGGAFLFAAAADCPIGLGFGIRATSELTSTPSYRYCKAYNDAMLARTIADPEIKSVVLSSRWTNWRIGDPPNPTESDEDIRLEDARRPARTMFENRQIFTLGLNRLIAELTAAGKSVYVVGPLPEPRFNVPRLLYVEHLGLGGKAPAIPRRDFEARHATILGIFQAIGRRHSVQFIWPHTVLCGPEFCPIAERGQPLYFDHNHLSVYGATKTAPLFAGVFGPS